MQYGNNYISRVKKLLLLSSFFVALLCRAQSNDISIIANQALLDALKLVRGISKGCKSLSHWKKAGVRESVLTEFESEMLKRSAVKVQDSAEAAQFLHSESVLHESDAPRRKIEKKKNT